MQALLLCVVFLSRLLVAPAMATPRVDRPVQIASIEDAAQVDDPRALTRAADHWRDQGKLDLARALYDKALESSELVKYLEFRDGLREALILERLGELDAAAAKYREGMLDDVHNTMQVLRIASVHPQRETLFQEAVADVRARVERAKQGEQVSIYTTSKGEPRYLEVIPDDQLMKRLTEDEGRLKYCYVENLDLRRELAPELPAMIFLSRCIIGRVLVPDRDVDKLILRSIVLGDVDVGKTWTGEVNKSATIPGSRFQELAFRDGIFLGRVNVQDVKVFGRNALFPLAVFDGEADFRDTVFHGTADFRFSVFAKGANFKGTRMTEAVYFGNTRYLAPVTFRGMFSEKDVYFNSAEFESSAAFDKCEWVRGATFENSTFRGPVSFNSSLLGGRLNMSRAVFEDTIAIREMNLTGMDFIGAWLKADAAFVDVRIRGKVRFSLDDITRAQHLQDPTPLLSLYRDYQGDQDADQPLTSKSSYGVEHVDDLIARIDGNASFANSVFEGFTIFERVQFGQPDRATTAEFYNAQFIGESHFERTTWYSKADFTTIFANELSFNEADFRDTLILDDANVAGRVTLTDAIFDEDATLSFYGAELASFQVGRGQVVSQDRFSWIWQASEDHRLFYKGCLDAVDEADPRIRRLRLGKELSIDEVQAICADRVIDEYVGLKQSFGDRAMTSDEDWAYWWIKHTELAAQRNWSGVSGMVFGLLAWPIFEIAFGWGVNLGNLAWTLLFFCSFFTFVYKTFCPDTVMQFDGDARPVRDIPWVGMFYVSLQSMGAFNTGWDFGDDDGRFRYINTFHTFLGVIIVTFFVGAYTRMILA